MKAIAAAIFLLITILLSPSVAAQEEAAVFTATISYQLSNEGANDALNVRATLFLFDNISGWAEQSILNESITLDGTPISPEIFSGDENRWTVVEVGDLKPGQKRTITVSQTIKVKSVDFAVDPSRVGNEFPPELDVCTRPVSGLFESDDPRIQELAAELTGGLTNPYLKLERIMKYVAENIRYERQPTEHGALWCLINGEGDCTEFSNLMIALARAVGIPAKAVVGYAYLPIYTSEETSHDIRSLGHEYAIFYIPGYGWIPADAVWPQYEGTLGKTDQYRLAGVTTDGSGVVREGGSLSWPGPGYVYTGWSYVSGKPTEVKSTVSGDIVPEVIASLDINVGGEMEEGLLPISVTVKNGGRARLENLVIRLNVDQTKFQETESPPRISSLEAGENTTVETSIRLLENAYGAASTIGASVQFDPAFSGTGRLSASRSITLNISKKPEMPALPQDMLTLAVIGIILAIVLVGVAIAIKR